MGVVGIGPTPREIAPASPYAVHYAKPHIRSPKTSGGGEWGGNARVRPRREGADRVRPAPLSSTPTAFSTCSMVRVLRPTGSVDQRWKSPGSPGAYGWERYGLAPTTHRRPRPTVHVVSEGTLRYNYRITKIRSCQQEREACKINWLNGDQKSSSLCSNFLSSPPNKLSTTDR